MHSAYCFSIKVPVLDFTSRFSESIDRYPTVRPEHRPANNTRKEAIPRYTQNNVSFGDKTFYLDDRDSE
jgi:hypothetical protein